MTWQPKLGGKAGERVEGYDELEQSMFTVLKTPCGAVPGRPEFGSLLFQIIDLPATEVAPAAVREVSRAIGVNEPRVTILRTTPTLNEDGGVDLSIRWKPTKPIDPARDAVERTSLVSV